jgi:iron complex outermembrane recepter protein
MAVQYGAIDPDSKFPSRRSYCYSAVFAATVLAAVPVTARAQENSTTLPPVHVEAPGHRPAPKPKQASTAAVAAKRRTVRASQPPKPAARTARVVDDGNGPNNNNSGPPLQQAPALGKTGTKLEDLPASVQIISREVVTEQGGTLLRDAVTNASGINTGGQDSLGYFDHFLIRGLNAQVYTDVSPMATRSAA